MSDTSLLMLAAEVRGKTLRLLDGVSEDMSRFAPAGLSNTILWHAGHALVVVEHLSVAPVTGSPKYPAGWFDTFGWNSRPGRVTSWPALAEVVDALREQLPRLNRAIESLSQQQLDQIVDSNRQRTLRYSILHGLHDEAGHQGEIWLLRKMYGAQMAAATSSGA